MKKIVWATPLVALVAACGGNGGNAAQQLKVVGSATVYPFTTAVAEAFQKANPGARVTVEATGTGAGMKIFCGGVGADSPDIENASRAMKKSEYDLCAKNGAKDVIEVPIGIDGLTLIQNKGAQALNLTQADIYKALAANPFGKGPNTAKTWHDVNPALPATPIRIMGPSPVSGTRDSLADLILTKGCDTDPAMAALAKSDDAKHKDICSKIREDGAYVEVADNPNLLVQKVSLDNTTLGVLGFSYLNVNGDKVKAVQIKGVSPSEATIADLSYPGARKLYIYVKGEHLAARPALKQFVTFYATQWGQGGALQKKGLVPFGGADATAATAQAAALKPLDPSTLK
ncbi:MULTISPECIES: substrate-binding domain-containing protein [Sphingomonas]|uniref:substrate-binding domain-containing protein n=1 Tax=Sphingomonas TaxID=13687 RepID=UPI000DEFC973|nr:MULTISPECIES: substrate-binding domain-containing protein [Sphingomonas]